MIGQPGAVWQPNPNYTKGWRRGKPHYVIIHGTAGGATEPAAHSAMYVASKGESTHYTVDATGTIVQSVSEENSAWGNGVISGPAGVARQGDPNAPHDAFWDTTGGDPNGDTISIETCRDISNTSPWSQQQTTALYALVAGICQRWGIPPQMADETGGITGHFSIDPVNRSFCPGPVDWESLVTAAGGSGLYTPPQGFPQQISLSQPAPPMQSFAGAPTAETQSNNIYLSVSNNVHETLAHAPGFYGICVALDEAEQYVGIYNPFSGDTNPSDTPANSVMGVFGTVSANAVPFLFRTGLIAMGVFLLIALFWQASGPMRDYMGSVPIT